MKRCLVGCALAMAILAASEQRASAGNGSFGFNVGVDVGFKFGWWSKCCDNCNNGPGYGYPLSPLPYYGHAGAPQFDGYANAPLYAPAPAAPAAAPAKAATSGAQRVGYDYYPAAYGYYPSNYGYGYGYGYAPSYWYGY